MEGEEGKEAFDSSSGFEEGSCGCKKGQAEGMCAEGEWTGTGAGRGRGESGNSVKEREPYSVASISFELSSSSLRSQLQKGSLMVDGSLGLFGCLLFVICLGFSLLCLLCFYLSVLCLSPTKQTQHNRERRKKVKKERKNTEAPSSDDFLDDK